MYTYTVTDLAKHMTVDTEATSCDNLRFFVSARNERGVSKNGSTSGGFPVVPNGFPSEPDVSVRFTSDGTPEVNISFTAPAVCSFQEAKYQVKVYSGGSGDLVHEGTPQLIENSAVVVEAEISLDLQANAEYYAIISYYITNVTSLSTNISITIVDKEAEVTPTTDPNCGLTLASENDNISQMTGFIVDIVMGTVLVIIVAILIILTCIILGMWRALKYNSGKASVSNRPIGATNKVFETCHLSEMGSEEVRQPVNNEPYYHTLEAPTGSQYHSHQPTEPVYHDPIHVTKIV